MDARLSRVMSLLAVSFAVCLWGCGGSRFGSELPERRPSPRPFTKAPGEKLEIPAEQPFCIALPKASRESGLGGTTKAEANAVADGNASALASVNFSGKADASFQLGHSIENQTKRQADFDVTVTLDYEYKASANPPTPYADAHVGLKLYARNDRNTLLQDVALFDHSTENGAVSSKSQNESVSFTVTLAPGESVSIYLAGYVMVDIREERTASGTLSVSNARMEITSRPAPAVKSADDEQ